MSTPCAPVLSCAHYFQDPVALANCEHDNRPFPSCPGPLFQNEGGCSAFDMEIIFHSHANITHFHKKGCTPSLILKVRVFGTRKWPIDLAVSRPKNVFQLRDHI